MRGKKKKQRKKRKGGFIREGSGSEKEREARTKSGSKLKSMRESG